MGFSLRKDVDFEIVLLRKVVRINEKRSQVVLSGIVSSDGCCLKKMIKKISVLSSKTQLTRLNDTILTRVDLLCQMVVGHVTLPQEDLGSLHDGQWCPKLNAHPIYALFCSP